MFEVWVAVGVSTVRYNKGEDLNKFEGRPATCWKEDTNPGRGLFAGRGVVMLGPLPWDTFEALFLNIPWKASSAWTIHV